MSGRDDPAGGVGGRAAGSGEPSAAGPGGNRPEGGGDGGGAGSGDRGPAGPEDLGGLGAGKGPRRGGPARRGARLAGAPVRPRGVGPLHAVGAP
ncbi:MAG: RDD family protein, partial [Bacillota bacterium]